MWMDEYVQELVLRERLTDLRRQAECRRRLRAAEPAESRTHRWPIIRQRLTDAAAVLRTWRRAERMAVR